MAATLNIMGDIALDSDAPTYQRVQVIVRKETATVSRGGDVLASKAGVLSVEQPQSRNWLIRFDDGTAWAASMPQKRGGCGCK